MKSGIFLLAGLLLLGAAFPGAGPARADTALPYPPDQEGPLRILSRIFTPHLQAKEPDRWPGPQYCGVEIAAMVAGSWSRMPPELRRSIPDRFRPPGFRDPQAKSDRDIGVCDAFLDSEHFRVHYSTDPENLPPGYPDLQTVRDLAENLETAYRYHRDVSGMGTAVPDGDFGGGQDLVDCYFYKLDDLFGYAHGVNQVPTECDHSYWGYLAVTTDFGAYDAAKQLRLTSEHEYYHILQFAHDPYQYTWFMESTARDSEFHVWPDIAVPRGAQAWMMHPYYSLWDGSGYQKYAPHFWFYLEAHHGWDFVDRIWNRCCRGRAEDALVVELAELGTDLDATMTDFAVWNYFTGRRDDGEHYDPAYNLPAVYHQAKYSRYPLGPGSLPAAQIARPGGSNYIRFDGPATDNNLQLTFDGHPDMAGRRTVIVLGVNRWGHRSWILEPDAAGDVDLTVPDWGLFDYVTMVVVNFWNAPGDSASLHYTYCAREVADPDGADPVRVVESAPNPFGSTTRVVYHSARDGSRSTIRIYDTSGRLVRTLLDEMVYTGLHQVEWDGRDQQGRLVPTGVYLVRLENGSGQHTGKVMFVR